MSEVRIALILPQRDLLRNEAMRKHMIDTGCLDPDAPQQGYGWVTVGGRSWTVLVPGPEYHIEVVEGLLLATAAAHLPWMSL